MNIVVTCFKLLLYFNYFFIIFLYYYLYFSIRILKSIQNVFSCFFFWQIILLKQILKYHKNLCSGRPRPSQNHFFKIKPKKFLTLNTWNFKNYELKSIKVLRFNFKISFVFTYSKPERTICNFTTSQPPNDLRISKNVIKLNYILNYQVKNYLWYFTSAYTFFRII